nr:MAG TPA: Putative transferase, nesg, ydcK, Structural Genomics.38A [Caudoviricetes sp.]
MKKFELTSESIVKFGKTLYRIRALVAFGDVKEGELGGFLEKEENLSQDGNAWVYGDAWVYGNARVYGDARVCGDAIVFKTSHYLVIGPMGSRNGFTTFFRTKNLFIGVSCGCFRGNVDEFIKKVKETHGDNKYAKTYLAAAELAKMQIDLTPEENEPEE